jgi:hypothetical protein
MTIDKAIELFFGVKIDSKLREALAQAKPGDRRYFEDTNGQFLQIISVGEERWIGKVIKAGLNVTEVEDIQRNVSSILRRIAPGVRQSPSSVKIFATAPGGEEPEPAEKKSSGPYIA